MLTVLDPPRRGNRRARPGEPAVPLNLQRLVERLHRRGPRPCGEVLAEALRRLAPADAAEVVDQAERIAAWPPGTIAELGADRFACPPLRVVPEGR